MSPATVPKLVCWMLILIISLAVCLYSILDKWKKFETSPVIVSFAETTTPIWQIPFPAVTVCSYTRSRARVYNYTRAIIARNTTTFKGSAEEEAIFEAVSVMCSQRNPPPVDFINKSALDIMRKVGPPMSEVINYVRWRNIEVKGETLFHPVLTHHGICYTMNMLNNKQLYTNETEQNEYFLATGGKDVTEWSLDNGYTKKAGLEPFPNRGWGTKTLSGLILGMEAYKDDLDYRCYGPHQGFKVYIHNPTEIPGKNAKYVNVPLDEEVTIAVTPTLMTTSEELKDYTPERRQCHYPSERKLRFFSVYTQANCALECLTNYTLYFCDCVPFYMPHDANASLCGPNSIVCVDYTEGELPKKEIAGLLSELGNITEPNSTVHDYFAYKECNCLPTCTELKYNTKITQSDFPWREVLHGFNELGDKDPGLYKARINVFFDESQIFTSRRSELYGRTDFLASCGGLLGLFMGFSILSLVEIIYFFTIRACCNFAKRKQTRNGLAPLAESDDTELEETKLHIP